MARVAGDVFFAVGELRINVLRHFDHMARREFGGFLIAGEVALYVAEVAPLAQGHREGTHHGPDIFRFENLEILRRGRRTFFCTLLGRLGA